MPIAQIFLVELKQEAASTRKLLATHIAEINGWWKECLVDDELDFAKDGGPRKEYHSTDDIVNRHDELIVKAEKILNDISETEFAKPCTMRNGEQIYFTLPKVAVVRTWCLNHLYHHRGQLTVYLRLLNIPVPGMYGPTADDQAM